jgi:hypothetical protein
VRTPTVRGVDLRRHISVLLRYRIVVVAGVLVGVSLAILATFRVTTDGLQWRTAKVYESSSVLFVTQSGFPWGRAALSTADPAHPGRADSSTQFADPGRFSSLATIYSFLVRSDTVRKRIPGHPPEAAIAAQPFQEQASNGGTLPTIGLTTSATSADAARKLNSDTIDALLSYVRTQQDATRTPTSERAEITILNPPAAAVLAQGRPLTKSIVLLLLCVMGAVGLAYVLENLRLSREADVLALPSTPTRAGSDEPQEQQLFAGDFPRR